MHAAELWAGGGIDIYIYIAEGMKVGGGAASTVEQFRSVAPIPSCMPCMSFLVFEAFH